MVHQNEVTNLLKCVDCANQNNSDDCGLFVIANAVAETVGTDPNTQEYDTELIRGLLINCLDQNEISLFPGTTRRSKFADGVWYLATRKYFSLIRCHRKYSKLYMTSTIFGTIPLVKD